MHRSPRFMAVRRKALWRVVQTLVVLWKVCLVELCFTVLSQAVKGGRLKCRQTVGCESCKGWRRGWCGLGLVAKLGSWMSWMGGWEVREGTNGDRGMKRGLLMVSSHGVGGWLGEGGLKAIRAWESGLETWREGGFQMGGRLVWLVKRGGRRR